MVERDVEQCRRRVQPRRLAGQLIQRQQPGGQRRVVLEDGRAVADPAAEAGPPQPAVHDMQVQRCARAHCVAASRNSGRPSATLASASAVIASPFHAVTTLSSRPGCGRVSRAASSAVRTRSNRSASSGSAGSCSTELPCSNVPPSVTLKSVCGPTPVVVAQHLAQLRGRPHVGQALAAVGVGVQRRREHAVGAQLVDHEPRRLVGHLARQRV